MEDNKQTEGEAAAENKAGTVRCLKQPDHSQIPIRRKDLKEEVWNHESSIAENLLYCIYLGPSHPDYKLRLFSAAMQGEMLARFVYKSKEGYRKLSRQFYERRLFLDFCESVGEVQDRLQFAVGRRMPEADAERILEKYLRIKELWIEAISFLTDSPFASELAYAADFVITHEDLPMPEFHGSMYPCNYPDYDYGSGIGEEFFGMQTGN